MSELKLVAFDADDTLWHNLIHFEKTEAEFGKMFADYLPVAEATKVLTEMEKRNIGLYGFGVKGFTLSMIESAINITGGKIDGGTITKLMDMGRAMLDHEIELLPYAEETLSALAQEFKLLLITKGDLHHQERKVLASGLAHYFEGVEIVSDKKPATYEKICKRYGGSTATTLMAGNSIRSDVLPMITAGGYGCYVPFPILWDHEHEEVPKETSRYFEVEDLRGVADVARKIIA
ncbi:HAD family hydrolase [Aestuariivirga litoralis]|uniref:HAD family hydrolase n=1 Tax=Aestuariivirga litoralis TaxID=2650924 RepID=UPI0018C74E5C|nr:HAD family hydrolase [Aestuariivirga litoralis]